MIILQQRGYITIKFIIYSLRFDPVLSHYIAS